MQYCRGSYLRGGGEDEAPNIVLCRHISTFIVPLRKILSLGFSIQLTSLYVLLKFQAAYYTFLRVEGIIIQVHKFPGT